MSAVTVRRRVPSAGLPGVLAGAIIVAGTSLARPAAEGQPPAAGDDEARAVVQRALERAAWNDDQGWTSRFRARMTREVRRYDGDGNITEEDHGDFAVFPIDGVQFERRLTINGRPLSDEEHSQQDEREAEFREVLREASGPDDDEDEDEIAFNDELIGRYRFRLEGEEPLRNRPAFRIAFEPRSDDLPIRRRIDHALNKARGTVWIDRDTYEAARVEFALIDRVRLWWGMLGTINRARGSLDRGPVLDAQDTRRLDVWAQIQFETYTDVRVMFSRTRRAELRRWRDFEWVQED